MVWTAPAAPLQYWSADGRPVAAVTQCGMELVDRQAGALRDRGMRDHRQLPCAAQSAGRLSPPVADQRRLLAEFEVWQRQFGGALGQVDVITARRFSAVWQRPESGHLSGCGPMADQTKVCRIAVEGQILPVSPVSSSRNWASTFVYIVSCAGNRRPSGRYLQIRFFGATVHAGAARITCSLNLTKSG